ncbi:hypothetical protein CES85_3249 (plasmid) [Ochrobactrum quorumnocens]|uniref:Uncharacterized protein n=1 Tax=Ochrobactrum quorumnocens TaxID=271865 RepID=A0A248UMN8_9HYPH|nr:hypothetical protein [[Ochrobactrum] quorumnocens]ASV87896.1 hypothetical protein CES85_3249 [[Ochrobactrum] quorumnocens]
MTGTIVAPGLANAERNPDIERYKTCELTVVYVDFDTSFQSTTIPFACLIQADCSVDPSMGQRK